MNLVLTIVCCGFSSFLLLSVFDPVLVGIIIGAVVLGCIFRGLYMIHKIYQVVVIGEKKDKGLTALEQYLAERDSN
ncbi:MAG: hypothetical protein RR595_11230 [Lysinibacillus sp.]